MNITKAAVVIFLAIALVVLGKEILFFVKKSAESGKRYQVLRAEMIQAQTSYDKVKADLEYYLNPRNLEKELRARFNYRSLGEKMLIIIPQPSSTNQ